MNRTVEFVFDFVSAPSYIAWKTLPALLEAVGATLVLTPVVATGIQTATGNPGPAAYPAKMDWYVRDLARWCKKRGISISPSVHWPFRSLPLLRGCLLAQERGDTDRYVEAMFDAVFLHARNMDDPAMLEKSMYDAGLDVVAYQRGIERQDIKDMLRRNTDEAVARKVFGVPTFFANGELFFGQDRIEFVMEALEGR
jgi:2-hydroxychromene-2-carboxylate isomerase